MAKKLSSRHYGAACRLAKVLNLPPISLHQLLKVDSREELYHIKELKKPDGGVRIIHAPNGYLKLIQRFIDREILDKLPVSDICHSYVKGRSIVTNANSFGNSTFELELDIRNAFGSSSFGDVVENASFRRRAELRHDFGMDMAMLEVLAMLVDADTPSGPVLPQGAPSSPKLFNYLCQRLDTDLVSTAGRYGHLIARYCDNFHILSNDLIMNYMIEKYIGEFNYCGMPFFPVQKRLIVRGNRPGVPLRACGINIMAGELYLPPKVISRLRNQLFFAGLQNRPDIRNGIKGYVFAIYNGWPHQLRDEYRKGRQRAYEIADKASQDEPDSEL